MRIRKRFPLSSSLSSLPFSSDPQPNRSPVVQQHTQTHADGNLCVQQGSSTSQPSDLPNQLLLTPSDRKSMIGSENPSWVCSINTNKAQEFSHKELEGEEEVKKERWGEEEKSNDRRKGIILGAEVGECVVPPSGCSSHHQEIGRWFERDKVIPLKKRKGSFEIREEKAKRTKAKMKSKTNKKYVQQNDDEQDQEYQGKELKERIDKNTLVAKKSSTTKRGSVIMEGSRCSRVNGRGWRCCQQTIVGYSLCEHHLGKGRLRSMTSTSMAAPKKGAPKVVSSLLSMVQEKEVQKSSDKDDDYDDYDDDEDEEEEKPLKMRKKKMMKIGMVKARSISSLLGQTSNVVVVVDDDDEKSAAYDEEK